MRILFALCLGIIIGAGAIWFFASDGRSTHAQPGQSVQDAAKSTRDAIQDKLSGLNLRPQDIKEELARTGQVVRRKARETGQVIADATVDTRITATIKGKLLKERDLSALSISVNTTAGVVTLSGSVSAPENISKAMLVAMETEGVKEVVSTLQVKLRPSPSE